MTTVQQVVETQLKIIDEALGPLKKIAEGAEKAKKSLEGAKGAGESFASKLLHGMKEVAGIAGVVGGALAFKGAWDSSEKYLKSIKEVKELTGATASETDFLFSNARKAGVEYEQMQGIMFRLSRTGSVMEQTLAGAGAKVPGMAKKFARLGVTVDKGPVKALTTMSDAVKSGKIDAQDLMAQFRIPPGAVNDFKGFLETLDKSTLAKLAAGKKIPGLLQDSDIDNFNKLEEAQHRIHDAWNRIKVMVMSKLYPIVAKMAEEFAGKLERFIPKAVAFGEALQSHMDQIVLAAKAFVTVMTGRKLLSTLEGLATAKGFIGKLASMAGGAPVAAVAAGGGGGMAGLLSSVNAVVAGFSAAAPLLLAIGAAVWLIYKGYQAIQDNVGGIKDRLLTLWDTITARFERMGEYANQFIETIGSMFGGGAHDFNTVGSKVAQVFEKVVQAFDFLVHVGMTVMSMATELADMFKWLWDDVLGKGFKDYVVDPLMDSMRFLVKGVNWVYEKMVNIFNSISSAFGGPKLVSMGGVGAAWEKAVGELLKPTVGLWKKHWDRTELDTKLKAYDITKERNAPSRETPSSRPPANNYDFRGSRFDITQNFAEGFDPDRIAVAFSNDLSALGEMRTQSGLAPAFAMR